MIIISSTNKYGFIVDVAEDFVYQLTKRGINRKTHKIAGAVGLSAIMGCTAESGDSDHRVDRGSPSRRLAERRDTASTPPLWISRMRSQNSPTVPVWTRRGRDDRCVYVLKAGVAALALRVQQWSALRHWHRSRRRRQPHDRGPHDHRAGPWGTAKPKHWILVLVELVTSGRLPIDRLITTNYKFEDIGAAVAERHLRKDDQTSAEVLDGMSTVPRPLGAGVGYRVYTSSSHQPGTHRDPARRPHAGHTSSWPTAPNSWVPPCRHGVARGDRVAYLGGNLPRYWRSSSPRYASGRCSFRSIPVWPSWNSDTCSTTAVRGSSSPDPTSSPRHTRRRRRHRGGRLRPRHYRCRKRSPATPPTSRCLRWTTTTSP